MNFAGARWVVAAICALTLAGCGAGGARPPAAAGSAVSGFEVHATPSVAVSAEQAAPVRRTPGCIAVRQGDAQGQRNCIPRKQVCVRGAIWWTKDLSLVCPPLAALPVRIVSAPDELPVGAAMCIVWAGTPSKIREGVLVVSSPHANCATAVVGTVLGPPAEPLAEIFPVQEPDCSTRYPGTRRAWPAKVTFADPPGRAWACVIG